MEHKIKTKLGKNRVSQKSVGKVRSRSIDIKSSEVLLNSYVNFHGKDLKVLSKGTFTSRIFSSSSGMYWGESQQNIKDIDYIISEKAHDTLLTRKSEHEVTREYISERFDKLNTDLANKEDLLKAKVDIIKKIEFESIQTQKVLKDEIFELKESLLRHLPHNMIFRISLYFVSLFLFAFFADMLGVQIIKPFWNILGMSVSAGFLIMAYFLFLDWQKCSANGTDS